MKVKTLRHNFATAWIGEINEVMIQMTIRWSRLRTKTVGISWVERLPTVIFYSKSRIDRRRCYFSNFLSMALLLVDAVRNSER